MRNCILMTKKRIFSIIFCFYQCSESLCWDKCVSKGSINELDGSQCGDQLPLWGAPQLTDGPGFVPSDARFPSFR